MALPVRNYTYDVNNTITFGDWLAGYQAICFALKEAFLNAGTGATNILSSNGTVAGSGDNWSTSADVVAGTAGNGSWWTAQLGSNHGGGDIFILLYVDEAAISATDSIFELRLSDTAWTGGSTTALPTTTGSISGVGGSTHKVFPTSDVNDDLHWHVWYSDMGDVFYACGQTATQRWSVSRIFAVFNDAAGGGGGEGARRLTYRRSSVSANSSVWDSSISSTQNVYIIDTGTWSTSGVISTPAQDLNFSNGISELGNLVTFLGVHLLNSSRIIGQHPDIYHVRNVAFNQLDANESAQTYRRVCVDDVFVFWPAASLPILS